MKIRLRIDTQCAHDLYEITNYPRAWFKPKPALSAGLVLTVIGEWGNFFGNYYKCEIPAHLKDDSYSVQEYDIPHDNAEVIEY